MQLTREDLIERLNANRVAATKINPNAVIWIDSALATLVENPENVKFEIGKGYKELSFLRGVNEVRLRARLEMLQFLYS